MCPPTETDQPSSSAPSGARSILGMGGLMLLACLGGPVLAGVLGGLGAGVLLGAGGVVFAFALCAAVPAVVGMRRRAAPPADARAVGRGRVASSRRPRGTCRCRRSQVRCPADDRRGHERRTPRCHRRALRAAGGARGVALDHAVSRFLPRCDDGDRRLDRRGRAGRRPVPLLGDQSRTVARPAPDRPAFRARRRGLHLPRPRRPHHRGWGVEDTLSRERQLGLPSDAVKEHCADAVSEAQRLGWSPTSRTPTSRRARAGRTGLRPARDHRAPGPRPGARPLRHGRLRSLGHCPSSTEFSGVVDRPVAEAPRR